MKQLTFLVICAHGKDDASGNYMQSTEVQVWAETEVAAITKAQGIAPGRAHYFTRSIIEIKPEVISEAEKMRLVALDNLTGKLDELIEGSK